MANRLVKPDAIIIEANTIKITLKIQPYGINVPKLK